MRCERFEEMMVEALYDELDDAAGRDLNAHLAECERCAAEFEATRGALGVMNRRKRRDPGSAYWDGYWDRLNERMDAESAAATPTSQGWWKRRAVSPARWAYRAAAAAAILTVGVFAGRTFFAPEVPVGVGGPDTVAERPADSAVPGHMPDATLPEELADNATGDAKGTPPGADSDGAGPAPARTTTHGGVMDAMPASSDRAMRYIEKSQMLLVALVNNDPSNDGYTSDFGVRRERSRRLVNEAAQIKDELVDPRQRRLRELVTDLEKILIQIANLESDEDMDGVEFIRSRVNEHDMLLKINLEQMRQGAGVDGSTSGTAPGSNSQRSI